MQIMVNGKRRQIDEAVTVSWLLKEMAYEPNLVAVAIDGNHLPKSCWDASVLTDENEVEIIGAMQGG